MPYSDDLRQKLLHAADTHTLSTGALTELFPVTLVSQSGAPPSRPDQFDSRLCRTAGRILNSRPGSNRSRSVSRPSAGGSSD